MPCMLLFSLCVVSVAHCKLMSYVIYFINNNKKKSKVKFNTYYFIILEKIYKLKHFLIQILYSYCFQSKTRLL